ncbi:MAG: N-acetylmuramoyl-L-alanine amidase [Actinomycetota bacterium]|nr:N-acetylmuramoyl-L-alanine amidase [Actinomycetota bacterium]
MATPLSADRLLAALLAEGVRVVEVGDWRTHNRNSKGPFGPVHGAMVHHTVTKGTAATVRLCRDGYSGLPGPLCHGVIAKDGAVHLVGHGRANHAGAGDRDVLNAVIAERALPADNETDADGNTYFYGFECENLGDGRDPWPAEQLEGIARACAAVCRAHGWGAESVIGHLEWQPGKIDPLGFTMASMRDRAAERLKHSASWSPAGPPKPPAVKPPVKPVPPKESSVTLTAADIKNFANAVADEVWTRRFTSPTAVPGEGDPTRQASTYLTWQDQHHAELMTRLDTLTTAIQHLTTQEN